MGLFSWFSPSPEKRLERARKMVEREQWADAYYELDGIEVEGAEALRATCQDTLALTNLDVAVSWGEAGDENRVRIHLELAEQFHRGGLEEQFRTARRTLREQRAARRAADEAAEAEREARLLAVDPLGFTGRNSLFDQLGDDLTGPDADETRARLALLVENYPDSLRSTVPELGPTFARAVLDIEDGRPDLALPTLLELDDSVALVRYERARAAYTLGDPTAAARELEAFAKLADGHHPIGASHTGVLLAQYTAEAGRPRDAVTLLRDLRRTQPKLGGFLFAQLLVGTGQGEEAEGALRVMIRDHPKEMALYKLLAIARIRGGHRVEAMNALERGLNANHCTPGRCGYRPPDAEAQRMLATLYLEDGLETKRALELADAARSGVDKPGWDDVYLAALVARQNQSGELQNLTRTLSENTPPGDPRWTRLSENLGLSAS